MGGMELFILVEFQRQGVCTGDEGHEDEYGVLVREHLRAEFGPLHLTALEISMERYLHSMVQHNDLI